MLKHNLPPLLSDASRRLVLVLLAAAILLQDLVWLVAVRLTDGWPAWPAIVAMALAFSQATVTAVLFVWSPGGFVGRSIIAIVNIVVAGYVAARCTNDNVANWIGIMTFTAGLVAAPPAVFRFSGVRLVAADSPNELPRRSRQFTIFGLFSLTTVVCVALGVARYLNFPWEIIGQTGIFVLAMGTIPWVASTLALCRVPVWVTLVQSAVLCPMVGWGLALTGFPPNDPAPLMAMTCLQGGITLGICAVIRVAGYHLAWPTGR
jgi:hypothetical protein